MIIDPLRKKRLVRPGVNVYVAYYRNSITQEEISAMLINGSFIFVFD